MLYKNTKVRVFLPDSDSEFINISTGVLCGNTLVKFMFIIYLDYIIRTSLNLKSILKNDKSR